MQVDFVVFRRREPLLAFVATLGFSRASFVRFSLDERADTMIECLRAAFEFFGGVPAEILFDNAKSVVLARDAYGMGLHRFHPKLLELANSHGFVPRLGRPYRAKTKGKVERFNRFLRSSFYVPLATRLKSAGLVVDAQTANLEVQRWLAEVANVRIHGTTGQRPTDVLVEERTQLLPLPVSVVAQSVRRVSDLPVPTESIQHPLSIYAELLDPRRRHECAA